MKNMFFAISACLLILSCQKEDIGGMTTRIPDPYMPLAVGNWWVYQYYKVDSNGVSTIWAQRDSVYISDDTLIGGQLYYKMHSNLLGGTTFQVTYVRDSAGTLVQHDGKKLFSAFDFSDTLNYYVNVTSNYSELLNMQQPMEYITVDAGTFNALPVKQTYYSSWLWGCHSSTTRITWAHYAQNIGRIKYQYFFSGDVQCEIFEARLAAYNLVP